MLKRVPTLQSWRPRCTRAQMPLNSANRLNGVYTCSANCENEGLRTVDFRQPGRSGGASHPSAAERSPDHALQREPCPWEFASLARDGCRSS